MIDYEKLAEGVELPESFQPKPVERPGMAFDVNTVFPAQEPAGEPPLTSNSSAKDKPAGKTTKKSPKPEPMASGPTSPSPEPLHDPNDPAAVQARLNREYLPLNHEKYQGIAAAKGYAQGDDFSGQRLLRVHYSHEAMIDVIIAEPTITQNELAKRFSRSVSWISIVMGSDSFQAALSKRRDDILDPFLVATVEERLRSLATQSLTVIADQLEKTRNADLALKALDISTKALGFGAKAAGGAVVQNNFVVQMPPKMADSSEWAKAHSGPLIEGN